MEKIPAKDRFSKNAKIFEVSLDFLKEAISKFDLSHQECQIQPLSGGFMNANFMVSCADTDFVFRVYSTNRVTAERERDMLEFLRSRPVKAPEALALFEVQGRQVAVLEYIDGMTLEDKILSHEPIGPRQYEEIGRQLAMIHDIHLGNMCSFLERKEDYQESFRTARVVIKSTLDHFGY